MEVPERHIGEPVEHIDGNVVDPADAQLTFGIRNAGAGNERVSDDHRPKASDLGTRRSEPVRENRRVTRSTASTCSGLINLHGDRITSDRVTSGRGANGRGAGVPD